MKTAIQTPCGVLRCTGRAGRELPFDVQPITKQYATAVWDEITDAWIPVTPIQQCEIRIDTAQLEPGETVTVKMDSDLVYRFGASDENAVCNVVTADVFSLSLGAYDPNDAAKDRQWISVYQNGVLVGAKPPEQYDTSHFRGYLLSVLPDWSGFTAKLLDRTLPQMRFRLVWVRHLTELAAEPHDYENAVTLIATF